MGKHILLGVTFSALESLMLIFADLSKNLDGAKIVTRWAINIFAERQIDTNLTNLLPTSDKFFRTRRVILILFGLFKLIYFRIRGERVIYIPLAGGVQLYLQLGLLLVATKLGYVSYVHHHSYSYIDAPSKFIKFAFRRISKNARHIFLTDAMHIRYTSVYRFFPPSFVISNATVVASVLNKNPYNHIAKYPNIGILHFGRLSVEKGINQILSVYSKLLVVHPKINCYLAGEPSDDSVKARITNLQKEFPTNFHYKSVYNSNDIPELTQNAHVFLFPSSYTNEAAPLVVYEAQLMGLVCLTTNVGSLPTVVKAPGASFGLSDWEDRVIDYLMKIHLLTDDERVEFFQRVRKEVANSTFEDNIQGIHEINLICEEIIKMEVRR